MARISNGDTPRRRLRRRAHRQAVQARALVVVLVTALLTGCGHDPGLSRSSSDSPASSPTSAAPSQSTGVARTPATGASPTPVASFGMPHKPVGVAPPWSAVGPGWFLVQEDLSTLSDDDAVRTQGIEKLWLVDPKGVKFLVLQWAAEHPPEAGLVDWSPDGRRALFMGNDTLNDVDLMTGVTRSFAVPHLAGTPRYVRPSGGEVVALTDDPTADPTGRGGVLLRYGESGQPPTVLASDVNTLVSPRPRWLHSSDGGTVYLPGAGGLSAVASAGGQPHVLDTIESATVVCSPARWWNPHTILVSCDEPAGPRLWLAPSSGGTATALTAPVGQDLAARPDWGAFDAVHTDDGQVFAQRPTACGGVDIAAIDTAGRARHLGLPDSLGIDWLVGVSGNRIAVHSTSSDNCYPRGWFGYYDVTTRVTQLVIDDPLPTVGASLAVAFSRE